MYVHRKCRNNGPQLPNISLLSLCYVLHAHVVGFTISICALWFDQNGPQLQISRVCSLYQCVTRKQMSHVSCRNESCLRCHSRIVNFRLYQRVMHRTRQRTHVCTHTNTHRTLLSCIHKLHMSEVSYMTRKECTSGCTHQSHAAHAYAHTHTQA